MTSRLFGLFYVLLELLFYHKGLRLLPSLVRAEETGTPYIARNIIISDETSLTHNVNIAGSENGYGLESQHLSR